MKGDGPKDRDPVGDSRHMRDRWLADLSQAMDLYMRSPAFLEWLRCSVVAMTEGQAMLTRSFASAFPKPPDASEAAPAEPSGSAPQGCSEPLS